MITKETGNVNIVGAARAKPRNKPSCRSSAVIEPPRPRRHMWWARRYITTSNPYFLSTF